MKKLKIIVFSSFVVLIGIATLTGCSFDNTSSPTSTIVSKTEEKKTEEEIKSNIEKEVMGITKSGDYVIKLKNNNDTQIYVDNVSIRFFDAEGNFTKKENSQDSYFCIPANTEVVTYIWGHNEDFDKYANSEIEVMLGDPLYDYYTENFEIKANDTKENIAVTITNNNDVKLDCIKINVSFIKDNKIVGIESGISYDEGIEANGGKAYINVDYPVDEDYEEVSFDKFEVYLISAYDN